jgi:hypothetical protein
MVLDGGSEVLSEDKVSLEFTPPLRQVSSGGQVKELWVNTRCLHPQAPCGPQEQSAILANVQQQNTLKLLES